MPTPERPYSWKDSAAAHNFERCFRSQLDAMEKSSKDMVREHQHNAAMTLLAAGIRLIPSDYLEDHQFVVSTGVYEAAQRILKGESG